MSRISNSFLTATESRKTRRVEILPDVADVTPTPSSLWRAVDESSMSPANITLLFIAGDSMHTKLVRMVLNSAGFVTRETAGTLDVAGAAVPSLVLLDWDAEGVDGHAILNALRTDPQLRQVPVIVLTNRSVSQGWCCELAKYFVSWVLEKPIVVLSLPQLIQRTIAARGHALQGCQIERSALLVENGLTASGALYKSVILPCLASERSE